MDPSDLIELLNKKFVINYNINAIEIMTKLRYNYL